MHSDVLQPGRMLPQLSLSTPEGTVVRISAFRGRKNLVLIFTAAGAPQLVAELLSREEDLEYEDAVVLVIEPAGLGQSPRFPSSRSFRLLLDADGLISRRFGADQQPAVYITDQYGEIYSAHRASEGATLPDADEVLASVRHINAACPE